MPAQPNQPNPQFERLRALSAEYGGSDAIPEAALHEIDYARIEKDGVVRVLPAAKLALEQTATFQNEQLQTSHRPPFEPLDFSVEVGGGYGTSIHAWQFEKDAQRALEFDDCDTASHNHVAWLPDDHQMNHFLSTFYTGTPAKVVDTVVTGKETIEAIWPDTGQWLLHDYSHEVSKALNAHYKLDKYPSTLHALFKEYVSVKVSDTYIDENRLTIGDAQKLWEFLECAKARLTDTTEIEAYFAKSWGEFDVIKLDELNEAISKGVLPPVPIDIGGDLPTIECRERKFKPEPALIFQLQLTGMQRHLTCKGFADVADRLQACATVADIRKVLNESLGNNEVEARFKQQEKALQAERRTLQSETEIHQFNQRYQAFKENRKATLRPLRGACDYMNMPTLYANVARQKINEVQRSLTSKTTGEVLQVSLNPRFDQRDMNHGEVSGDCTDDSPLPFGTRIPAFNIKIEVAGQHVGNIYQLETTAAKDINAVRTAESYQADAKYKVWHLDAIQWPSFEINWETFPQALVDALATHAINAEVDFISINQPIDKISNYDYIGKAFLRHLGATNLDAFRHMPDLSPSPNTRARTVYVDFPDQLDGYNQFQGVNEAQLILWQNPNSAL